MTEDKTLTVDEIKKLDPKERLKRHYKVSNFEWVSHSEYRFTLPADDFEEHLTCVYVKDDEGYWSYTTEDCSKPKSLLDLEARYLEADLEHDQQRLIGSISVIQDFFEHEEAHRDTTYIEEAKKPLKVRKGIGGQSKYEYSYYLANHANLAELFVVHFDYSVRYCPKTKAWFLWDEKRWVRDEKNHVFNMIIELSQFIEKDARSIKNQEWQSEIVQKAKSLGNLTKLKSVVEMLKVHPCVATLATEFDINKQLIGLKNGVYDLDKAQFRKAKKEDMVTESLGVTYSEYKSAPKWEQFLNDIFEGDKELISYMQKVIGYSLSGDISEQAIWFAHGNGSNGKSVFFSVLQNLFGTYYVQAQPSLFDRDDKNMEEAKMMLKGKRLAIGTELQRGIRLDIKTVKDLTGGEPITGRNLYERSITYTPTAKIFTFGNHKFSIADTDPALWRRFVIIPFLRNFSGAERRNGLVEELLEELDGIFNWAVEGYEMWFAEKNTTKLAQDIPQICQVTKNDYMFDEDYIAQFLEQTVDVGDPENKKYRISKSELYSTYKKWCEEDGVKAKTKKNFNNDIKAKGFVQKKSGEWYWCGMRSQEDTPSSTAVDEPEDIDDMFDFGQMGKK